MNRPNASLQPLYLQVKRHILDNIGSGKWGTSARVPSENDIVKSFGVSRMTANRALRELRDEGVLVRIAGVGSFVADQHAHAHPLEIRGIADEIRAQRPRAPRRDRFAGADPRGGRTGRRISALRRAANCIAR